MEWLIGLAWLVSWLSVCEAPGLLRMARGGNGERRLFDAVMFVGKLEFP
jgi:hypothetical protein